MILTNIQSHTLYRDEKSTLLSQISTLQGQQSALGSRLESLTQAADNAMAREREAEDRLDSVLTQHARQISQRQVRICHTIVCACRRLLNLRVFSVHIPYMYMDG